MNAIRLGKSVLGGVVNTVTGTAAVAVVLGSYAIVVPGGAFVGAVDGAVSGAVDAARGLNKFWRDAARCAHNRSVVIDI